MDVGMLIRFGKLVPGREQKAFRDLNTKAVFFVDHFRWDLITVGEGVQEQVARASKVLANAGY